MRFDPHFVPSFTSGRLVRNSVSSRQLRNRPASAGSPVTTGVRLAFGLLACCTDILTIMLAALGSGIAWHLAAYHIFGEFDLFLQVGFLIALLFVIPNAERGDYQLGQYRAFRPQIGKTFFIWNIAFVAALTLGFMTKSIEVFSRGAIVLFYVGGITALLLARAAQVQIVRKSRMLRSAAARPILLVGHEQNIQDFSARYSLASHAIHIVSKSVLRPEPENLGDDLRLAAATARVLRPEEVFILVPWSESATIDACVQAFLQVPASIHLGPDENMRRFSEAPISRVGPVFSLDLVHRPLSIADIIIKRLFDLAAATLGLVLLSPLLAMVAIAIRLDSKGPVLFVQHRYGFNQEPFGIVKFRSMTVLENGRNVEQATEGDTRVTRVGRILRRWNIDELPQLLNVIKGDMSLVGPRPHALAHDQEFGNKVVLYARRHNVRPGITGWAQVNGHRGAILSDEGIRHRVDHDLYYIDNWSLLFDLKIIALTIFSRRAYRNAL